MVGVDFDAEIIEQSRATFPQLPVVSSRLYDLTLATLAADGFPTSYDLVVRDGNVMILLAPEHEQMALANLAALLGPNGRLLVGFALSGAPSGRLPHLPRRRVPRRLRGDRALS